MAIVELNGIEYEFIRGSDIQRDGMYLEVSIAGTDPLQQLAEVFFSDVTKTFSVSCFELDVPLEVIEELIQRARRDLPPLP